MSIFDLHGPIPNIALPDRDHSFARVMLGKARQDGMSLRDLANLTAAARGYWVLCGSADTLQYWFVAGAAGGFNVMPPHFHEGFTDIVDLVVPILQARGLFRRTYEGTTLRDRLGSSSVGR